LISGTPRLAGLVFFTPPFAFGGTRAGYEIEHPLAASSSADS